MSRALTRCLAGRAPLGIRNQYVYVSDTNDRIKYDGEP